MWDLKYIVFVDGVMSLMVGCMVVGSMCVVLRGILTITLFGYGVWFEMNSIFYSIWW